MSESIYIPNKLCTVCNTYYKQGVEIMMPLDSDYAGYKMFVNENFVDKDGEFYKVTTWKDDYQYVLEKIEREKGKRYSRPKLYFDDLKKIFSTTKYKTDGLNKSLAYVTYYANTRNRFAGEVAYRTFEVGFYDDVWFYVNDQRRRLNSKGVKLLNGFTDSQIEEILQKQSRLNKLKMQESYFSMCRIKPYFDCMSMCLQDEQIEQIKNKVNEINSIIDKQKEQTCNELKELDSYFNDLISSIKEKKE